MKRLINKLLSITNHVLDNIINSHIGLHKGKNVEIRRNVFMDNPSQVYINDNCFVNNGCEFHLGVGKAHTITLEDNVYLGPNVSLICVSHNIGSSNQRAGANTYMSIKISKGAWIGANTTILPGVTIGKGAIVAAGSVVNRDIPSNQLWGGGIAKYIKDLNE